MDIPAAARELRVLFDAHFYLSQNPDVLQSAADPVEHYLRFGSMEGRHPCKMFDDSWYRARYPDVTTSGLNPLLHYIRHGGMELRDPNPRFNAAYYVDEHPEAIGNPLLYHLLVGLALDWPTEPLISLPELLPSQNPIPTKVTTMTVDVIIPVFRGHQQTIRCIESVLSDNERPPGRILVVDDQSPEPRLSKWLDSAARQSRVTLLRNSRNLGFVRSVNRGMTSAGRHDVVLLNSDTEVANGWLNRLQHAAYSQHDIATVSPLSNNATICSYPTAHGAALPAGLTVAEIDGACSLANAGRVVDLPTTVGFCMYIRRAALDSVGDFDAKTFGHGYGEEVDFCRRASAQGWRHALACDVFVYHEGAVSFGPDSKHARRGRDIIRKRYPDYEATILRHARRDPAHPARFALTAALFRQSRLPGILFVSHGQGGGIHRQIREIINSLRGKANVMLLHPDPRGVGLSVPTVDDHPVLSWASDRVNDLAQYLQSAAIQRVHIHHLMDLSMDVRSLVKKLNVPFDLTVHDYFGLCPQINFLPFLDAQYCGEPDARYCNACIAMNPNNGATDIDSWRLGHVWMFREAARIICPSDDTRARLARYGLANSAIVAPHERVSASFWTIARVDIPSRPRKPDKLQVALLGVLADRKGLPAVMSVAEAAGDSIALHLIGYPEQDLNPKLAIHLSVSGAYEDKDLPTQIARLNPHVFWFPAQWPETYSYTLSAAINAGNAIVAADIGAFRERLAGRPMIWLVPPDATAQAWLNAFSAAREALHTARISKQLAPRALIPDYYAQDYLQPLISSKRQTRVTRSKRKRPRVLIIPERLDSGIPSPCGYIRLLQPLNHPTVIKHHDVQISDEVSVLAESADFVVTQRHAIKNPHAVEALITHCRNQGIRLIYDLDDDLTSMPDGHPDAARLHSCVPLVHRLMEASDTIWVSTPTLAASLGSHRKKAQIVPNGIDERLWWIPRAIEQPLGGPIRFLCMGTGTHDADLALILPALERLQATFSDRVAIDIVGVTPFALPAWLNRINPPHHATRSYPAFVNWLSLNNIWHIGLAPLMDTQFNRSKSAIKAMDYAALGLPTVASKIDVYDSVIRHGENGLLVMNTDSEWFSVLAALVRNPRQRQLLAASARASYDTTFTLASQAAVRRQIFDVR